MQNFEFRKSGHHRPSDRDINDGNKDRKTPLFTLGGEMRECRATLPHHRNFHDVRGRGGGARERNRLRILVTFKRLARLDDTIKIDFVFIFVLS